MQSSANRRISEVSHSSRHLVDTVTAASPGHPSYSYLLIRRAVRIASAYFGGSDFHTTPAQIELAAKSPHTLIKAKINYES